MVPSSLSCSQFCPNALNTTHFVPHFALPKSRKCPNGAFHQVKIVDHYFAESWRVSRPRAPHFESSLPLSDPYSQPPPPSCRLNYVPPPDMVPRPPPPPNYVHQRQQKAVLHLHLRGAALTHQWRAPFLLITVRNGSF